MELKKPEKKREIQVLCGMMSSLQRWYPSLPLNLTMLRKLTVGKGKVEWTEELEVEYQNAMDIMKTRIKLSPYDPTKKGPSQHRQSEDCGNGLCPLSICK